MHEFLGDVHGFLTEIFSKLEASGIDVSRYELDHLCYRVETQDQYLEMKHQLGSAGKCLGEHLIGGRPIATYKLHFPIVFEFRDRTRSIACVELPSPKSSSPYVRGLEHAEFVIDESFEEFMEKYSYLNLSIQGMEKKHHPQIQLKFGGKTVKFHHMALDKIIELESGC